MTKIEYCKKRDYLILDIKGHANYNPGNDIVCAGISTLACTLAETLRQEEEKGSLKEMKIEIQEGDVWIECVYHLSQSARIEAMFYTITNGLALIAETYPDNVEFSQK